MTRAGRLAAWGLAFAALSLGQPGLATASEPTLVIGSKSFTESVILGEMMRQLAIESGAVAVHRRQLGGTRVVWNALLNGEVDAYPEYTGTLLNEILAEDRLGTTERLRAALAARGIGMTGALGSTFVGARYWNSF